MLYSDVSDNKLEGSFPKALPASLLALAVSDNELTGTVSSEFFELLPILTYL